MEEIAKRNKQLREDCKKISDDVKTAMEFDGDIDKKIVSLIEVEI